MFVYIIKYDYCDYTDEYTNKFHSVHITIENLREELTKLAFQHNIEKDFSSLEIHELGTIQCFETEQISKFDQLYNYYVETYDAK
jgi:hypothetical protein